MIIFTSMNLANGEGWLFRVSLESYSKYTGTGILTSPWTISYSIIRLASALKRSSDLKFNCDCCSHTVICRIGVQDPSSFRTFTTVRISSAPVHANNAKIVLQILIFYDYY